MIRIRYTYGMNRNHLTVFHAVAEAGGFSRAAERLMISQPAVSLQVGELEKAVRVKLFDRLPRGVRLTEAGEVLLGYTRRIDELERQAERALLELRGLERGRLTLGASQTIGSYVMPRLMEQFRRLHPNIELGLEIANTRQIQQWMMEDRLDVALTEGIVREPELQSAVFAEDELVVIAPAGQRRALRTPLTAAQVCRRPLIFREKGSGTRDVVERALAEKGLTPVPAMYLGSTEAIKAAVASGMGWAIVSALAIETELKAGVLAVVPVADLPIRRSLHRLWRRGKTLSPAAQAFVALLPQGQKHET